MRFSKRFCALTTACALMGAGCWYPSGRESRNAYRASSAGDAFVATAFIDADRFAIPELEKQAARRLPDEEGFACKSFRAGIVNHHALASDLLAGFFRTLKRCRPDIGRFIILSPDHNLAASAPAVTHRLPYRVGGRELALDTEAVTRLRSVAFVREEPVLFEREHGVGALLPFLAERFPDARLVPVVVKTSILPAERRAIASRLEKELEDPQTFLVVSADMSHYLDERTALANDEVTNAALAGSDADFFVRANDDFTDNGKSIAIVMEALDAKRWTPFAKSISSAYAGSDAYTTTYLVGFWE